MALVPARLRPLGELVDVIGGGTPSKDNAAFWSGPIPWVSPKDMKSAEIFETIDHISEAALATSACKLIEPPAVLFVVRGMILVHTLPVAVSRVPLAINQDMKALRPREGLDAEYLAYVLGGASHELLAQVDIAGHGTRRLKSESWQQLLVPVPSIDEQRRIVTRVRDALERIDELRLLREQTLTEAQALLPSSLAAAYEEMALAYPNTTVEKCLRSSHYGTSRKCDAGPGAVPILRIPNVANGEIAYENLKFCELPSQEHKSLELVSGDVLVVRTNGSPELVGRCAVFEQQDRSYAYASYLIRLRLDLSRCNPFFLGFFLASTLGRDAIARIRRTSAGQYNINSENLRGVELPLPPLSIQNKVSDRLATLRAAAAALLAEQRDRVTEIEPLRSSILRKAFAGEL